MMQNPIDVAYYFAGYEGDDEQAARAAAIDRFESWGENDGMVWLEFIEGGIAIGPVIHGKKIKDEAEEFIFPFEIEEITTPILDIKEQVIEVEGRWVESSNEEPEEEPEEDWEEDEEWDYDDYEEEDDWDDDLDDDDW